MEMKNGIEAILAERRHTHGDFQTASETLYELKNVIREPMQRNKLPKYRIEAVEAILAKINRIVHGNHDEEDHWDDIMGYAKLGSQPPSNGPPVIPVFGRQGNITETPI